MSSSLIFWIVIICALVLLSLGYAGYILFIKPKYFNKKDSSNLENDDSSTDNQEIPSGKYNQPKIDPRSVSKEESAPNIKDHQGSHDKD